jgi:hypothetical protein
MERYYFHIEEDGDLTPDEQGQEFADQAAVRKQAIETAAAIAKDAFVAGLATNVVVEVRNTKGLFLRASVSMTVHGPDGL